MKNIKINKIESYLPIFPGFYCTIFEPCEDNEIEYYQNEYGKHIQYEDIKFFYEDYRNDVGMYCCDYVENELNFYLQTSIKINFQNIYSPKFYNFKNDSINCEYSFSNEDFNKIHSFLLENKDQFEIYLKENFTSFDGFISFYSNKLESWLNYSLNDYLNDSFLMGAILDFILKECIENPIIDMYYHCQDHCYLSSELKERI